MPIYACEAHKYTLLYLCLLYECVHAALLMQTIYVKIMKLINYFGMIDYLQKTKSLHITWNIIYI